MGGVLILIGLFFGVFLWADLYNPYNWLLIFITFSFGILGAFDDYKKIKNNNSKGISSKLKLIIQIIIGLISLVILYNFIESNQITNLYFPFLNCISFGISTKTGPGLPVVATSKARCKTLERSFTSFTNQLCFVHGLVIPVVSHS